jgi:hypothetical protein
MQGALRLPSIGIQFKHVKKEIKKESGRERGREIERERETKLNLFPFYKLSWGLL